MRTTLAVAPSVKARLGGASWLMTFLTSSVAMALATKLIVAGDAAATASNIMTHQIAFRSSTALLLISTCFYVGATLFVYEVMQPVNKSLSLLAAFFSLTGCAIGALACVFDLVPFILLGGVSYLGSFSTTQLQGLTLALLKLRGEANNIGLVFFGLHCFGVGYLIFRSTYLPRVIGLLMMFAGLGWLTFLWPPLTRLLAPYNLMPGGIGELSLTLWLLVKGVNDERWWKQAASEEAKILH